MNLVFSSVLVPGPSAFRVILLQVTNFPTFFNIQYIKLNAFSLVEHTIRLNVCIPYIIQISGSKRNCQNFLLVDTKQGKSEGSAWLLYCLGNC